jgi:nicotinate-nucleotide pyrophosphorylase (carboxylating)
VSLPRLILEPLVRATLAEDLGGAGDITSMACIPKGTRARAELRARKAGVLAGIDCAALAFELAGPSLRIEAVDGDGARIAPGRVVLTVQGDARAILAAERTALNFVTHLSGIATLTRAYVDAVAGAGAVIAPTRKTLPLLRAVQKAAAQAGGAAPHRFGLGDAVLIKDNHVAAAGGVAKAIAAARRCAGHMAVVSVEVDTLAQLDEALEAGPDVVLLDNFSLQDLREAVGRAKGKVTLEASGGVSLDTVRAIAETGVDVISVGALTHSAPALDFGLDFV